MPTGILHAGDMIGRDRKTDRKTRRTFVLLFLFRFWEGWIRDTGCRGSAGDGFDGDADEEGVGGSDFVSSIRDSLFSFRLAPCTLR